jgi:hypothetical protein
MVHPSNSQTVAGLAWAFASIATFNRTRPGQLFSKRARLRGCPRAWGGVGTARGR